MNENDVRHTLRAYGVSDLEEAVAHALTLLELNPSLDLGEFADEWMRL